VNRDEAERLFYQQFDTISEMAGFASGEFTPIEAEAFDIYVKEKLVEDDYRRIRKYEGRNGAKFRTYLASVLARLLQDYRDRIWGRWRPTKKATRAGGTAVLMERLLREHRSYDEIFEMMRTDYRLTIDRAEFERLTAHVNPRFRPRIESVVLPDVSDPSRTPEQLAILHQMLDHYCALLRTLRRICGTFRTEDALVLKYVYEDGHEAGTVENLLGWKPNRRRGGTVFKRLELLTKRLKKLLEGEGFSIVDVRAFLQNPGLGDGCDDPAEAHS
jgi:hypothetical protein